MKNLWNIRHESFKRRNLSLIIHLLILTLSTVSQGCKKDISSIGIGLRDDLLNATFSDSTTLVAYSVLEDSLNTTNLSFNYLGHYKENVFGATTAGIFTQLVPSKNNVNFGDSPQLDSIVLTLRYSGNFYGDTLNPIKISVYELSESMSEEKYFQYSTIDHNGTNLTYGPNFMFYPRPNSKVYLDTVYEAHIRIRLSDNLGNSFLRNADKMSTANEFKNFFKGLYICAEPCNNSGSLVNVNLSHELSGIKLYYKRNGEAGLFSFFVRSEETIRFGHYVHDYTSGDPNFVNQVLNQDTSLGRTMLYVQAMCGVKTKISFPNVKSLRNKKVVINKAELVIKNIGEELSYYPQPERLTLQTNNSSGTSIFLPDHFTSTNLAYWGGGYDKTKEEYRFRITRYIQEVIQRDHFEPFIYLLVEGAAANANRLILSGTNPTDPSRLRLELYYTEY